MRHSLAHYASDVPDESVTNTESTRRMPPWVPKAVLIFWAGFIGTLVFRFVFHRLNSLLILLLLSLFIALAVEPATNKLTKRGMSRSSSTALILLGIVVVASVFLAVVGTVVAQQLADLLSNSSTYVNDTVKMINDLFNSKIDPAAVNESIADPNGPVQRFIRASFRRSVPTIFCFALLVLHRGRRPSTPAFHLLSLECGAPTSSS
jgi:predicted PurR-regulated permease PerM